MNEAIKALEGSGAMYYEDLDEIAFCNLCGNCHPAKEHCKCFKLKMERDQKAIDRHLRFELLAFIFLYVLPMISGISLGMLAVFNDCPTSGACILGLCFFLSLFVLIFTEPNQPKKG